MTTAMKSLAEMTTSELESLKVDVSLAIVRQMIRDAPADGLIWFERAIDSELDRRGA